MAAAAQADCPALTGPVVGLFERFHLPGHGLKWLAEELLTAALGHSPVVVEAVPDGLGSRVLYCLTDQPSRLPHVPAFLIRPLAVRLISIGRAETGADLDPYGDRFTLRRGGADLHLDISNTPALQRLQIVRSPAAG